MKRKRLDKTEKLILKMFVHHSRCLVLTNEPNSTPVSAALDKLDSALVDALQEVRAAQQAADKPVALKAATTSPPAVVKT